MPVRVRIKVVIRIVGLKIVRAIIRHLSFWRILVIIDGSSIGLIRLIGRL
jgi:hypothetical protein